MGCHLCRKCRVDLFFRIEVENVVQKLADYRTFCLEGCGRDVAFHDAVVAEVTFEILVVAAFQLKLFQLLVIIFYVGQQLDALLGKVILDAVL